ncbi:MAG: hypothetical protein LBT32_09325 [Peptococcaceae bacterium]|nr:hypothetical protein [Peptococcaceae bacterium]
MNGTINTIMLVTLLVLSTTLFVAISKKYFNAGKLRYIAALLWLPYFIILLLAFSYLLPITNPQDMPLGGTGFLFMGIFLAFPIYIVVITAICTKNNA